jgi:integrase
MAGSANRGARVHSGLRSRIARRNKLALRLHDLHHAYASLALQAGVNLKVVSESLGHTVIATTANLYSHVTPALLADQAARIDALVTGKRRLHAVPKRRAS